jgi:hypothetical protein
MIDPNMVPYDTYLASDWSDIHSKLGGKDGVEKHPDALFSQPGGDINFWDGNPVPADTQIWIIAADDRQVVGELDIQYDGGYDLSSNGIYGDNSGGVDEGASMNEILIVVAKIGDQYYQGSFISGSLASGYTLTDERCDIEITNNVIAAPEPATQALLGFGAVTLLMRRRRRADTKVLHPAHTNRPSPQHWRC